MHELALSAIALPRGLRRAGLVLNAGSTGFGFDGH